MSSLPSSLYRRDRKLLIIHADDFGMCHSVNLAIIAAFEQGAISSASVMVPCAWFMEAAEYSRRRPERDIGVHLTLTSEWMSYRWRPLSPKPKTSTLTDNCGYFWPSADLIGAKPENIWIEIVSQVSAAVDAGVAPSHVDNHMFSLMAPQYIGTYVRTSRQCGLPFLIDAYWHSCALRKDVTPGDDVVVDMVIQAEDPHLPLSSMEDFYLQAMRDLQPGLNQLIVHPGSDDEELRAITGDQKAFGAAWRQRDFDILTGDKFRHALKEYGIVVTNWGGVMSSMARRVSCGEESL